MSTLRERALAAYQPDLDRRNEELAERMLRQFEVYVEPDGAAVIVDGLKFRLGDHDDLSVAQTCVECGRNEEHLGGDVKSLRELGRELMGVAKHCWECEHHSRNVPNRDPHRCPICGGSGAVLGGFYGTVNAGNTADPETCRSCAGVGVLWTPLADS